MIDIREKEIVVVDGLKEHLGCEVVMANQATKAPKHPYVSYTIVNLLVDNNGTYGVYEDGYKRKEYQQGWSFTVQAGNDTESKRLALQAHEYFSEIGRVYLSDNGIVVQIVGGITCRDSLITIGYEYRNGFDVTFSLMSEIDEQSAEGVIEHANVNGVEVDAQLSTDKLNDMLEKRLDGEVS